LNNTQNYDHNMTNYCNNKILPIVHNILFTTRFSQTTNGILSIKNSVNIPLEYGKIYYREVTDQLMEAIFDHYTTYLLLSITG